MGDTTARGVNLALLCGFSLLVSACADARPAEEVGGGSRLELPMVPVESGPLVHGLEFDQVERVMRLDTDLVLAMGDGYPTEFVSLLQTGDQWLCSDRIGDEGASLRFERAELEGSAVTVVLEEGGAALRIRVLEEGQVDVLIFGTFDPAGWVPLCYEGQMTGEPVAAEVRLRIRTIPVGGVELMRSWPDRGASPSECRPERAQTYTVATSSLPGLVPLATDALGERFFPANAANNRAVSVTLVAERGRPLEAPAEDRGLDGLRFPDAPGPVHIDSPFGQRRTITVVDDSAVTALDVQMLLVGSSRTPISLHDGDNSWLGTSIVVRPSVGAAYAGEERLCSSVDPSWFELSSETSDRCKVEPSPEVPFSEQGGLDAQVRPVSEGECAIRLRAPGIDKGEGFERTLSVTFSEQTN